MVRSNYPPAKPGALRLLAPQRGLIAIGQNQNREPFVVDSVAKALVVVIPAKAGIQFSLDWIPGRVSLARNDDSTFPELLNSGSPPAEPGVYLNANYLVNAGMYFFENIKIDSAKSLGKSDLSRARFPNSSCIASIPLGL